MRKPVAWVVIPLVVIVAALGGWWLWLGSLAPRDFALKSVEVDRVIVASSGDHRHHVYSDVLRTTFTSSADLQSLARRGRFHLHFEVSPCRDGTVDPGKLLWTEGWGQPFDGFGAVDMWSLDGNSYRSHPSGPRDVTGAIPYHFLVDVRFMESVLPEKYHYDLVRSPEQLCAILHGYKEIWIGISYPAFQSNVIVIPRKSVADAISRATLQ